MDLRTINYLHKIINTPIRYRPARRIDCYFSHQKHTFLSKVMLKKLIFLYIYWAMRWEEVREIAGKSVFTILRTTTYANKNLKKSLGCRIARRIHWCNLHRKLTSQSNVMLEKHDFPLFIVEIGGKNRVFRF